MVHIVFQEADIEALSKSFALDESLRGDIIHIKDDYAVGPLHDLYGSDGIEARKAWWREVLAGGHYDGLVDSGSVDDYATVASLTEMMQQHTDELAWIWVAPNKHDVSGYYWLLHFMQPFQGRTYILNLNNLPFINDKGLIFYPVNLSGIPPREFVKAQKLARAITPAGFELDMEEWRRLCQENKGVRILDSGKKLIQYEDDYYDPELLHFIGAEWQKAGRLMYQFLSRARQTTGDAYLLWRLKQLIRSGKVAVQGDMKNMKDFEVKVAVQESVQLS